MIDTCQLWASTLRQKWLPDGTLRSRFAMGTLWVLIGTSISRALALISSMMCARLIGRAGFGELGMIQSTVGMFGVFSGLGLGMTATKYVAEFREKDPSKTGRILGMSSLVALISGAIMAIILILLAPYLSTKAITAPHLAIPLAIGAGLLFFSAINGAQMGALSGFEAFKQIAWVNLFSGIVSFPMVILGAWKWGVAGATGGLVASLGVNCIFCSLALRREAARMRIVYNFLNCMDEWPILLEFSLPSLLSGLVLALATWVCNAMLVHHPNGYAEMGIFNAANQWRTVLLFLPAIIGQIAIPIMANTLGVGELRSTTRFLRASIIINTIFLVPISVLIIILSPWVMAQYGGGFREGWLVLSLTVATSCLLGIQTPVGQVIAASGRMWAGFVMNTAWGIILLLATWELIAFGAVGLAVSYLIAYVMHGIWTFWFARKYLQKQDE